MDIPSDYRFKNLTGRTFNRLTVLEYAGEKGKKKLWSCRCACGATLTVYGTNLIQGYTQSCGCIHDEIRRKHGLSKTREYQLWLGIIGRTTNPNNSAWKNYGRRGVKLCKQWRKSFTAFIKDMGPCPSGYTIERIDPYGDYVPENCKWIPKSEQPKNRRNSRRITFQGQTKILSDWSKEYRIPYSTLLYRLRSGWTVDKALTHTISSS